MFYSEIKFIVCRALATTLRHLVLNEKNLQIALANLSDVLQELKVLAHLEAVRLFYSSFYSAVMPRREKKNQNAVFLVFSVLFSFHFLFPYYFFLHIPKEKGVGSNDKLI